ncbi:hypothetical protein U1Q18_013050, partial [Sarracenia purpurea var. burkii]
AHSTDLGRRKSTLNRSWEVQEHTQPILGGARAHSTEHERCKSTLNRSWKVQEHTQLILEGARAHSTDLGRAALSMCCLYTFFSSSSSTSAPPFLSNRSWHLQVLETPYLPQAVRVLVLSLADESPMVREASMASLKDLALL